MFVPLDKNVFTRSTNFFVLLCNKVSHYQSNYKKLSTDVCHIIQNPFHPNHQCLSHYSIQFITLWKQCHTGLFSHCNSNIVTLCNFHWGGTDVVTRVTTSLNGGQLSHFTTSEAWLEVMKAVVQYFSFLMAGEFSKDPFFALIWLDSIVIEW